MKFHRVKVGSAASLSLTAKMHIQGSKICIPAISSGKLDGHKGNKSTPLTELKISGYVI